MEAKRWLLGAKLQGRCRKKRSRKLHCTGVTEWHSFLRVDSSGYDPTVHSFILHTEVKADSNPSARMPKLGRGFRRRDGGWR